MYLSGLAIVVRLPVRSLQGTLRCRVLPRFGRPRPSVQMDLLAVVKALPIPDLIVLAHFGAVW